MEFEVNIKPEDVVEQLKNSIAESDVFQEQITKLLESDEITELITKQISELLSGKCRTVIGTVIENELIRYIEEDFDLEDHEEIMEELTNATKKMIRARLKNTDC